MSERRIEVHYESAEEAGRRSKRAALRHSIGSWKHKILILESGGIPHVPTYGQCALCCRYLHWAGSKLQSKGRSLRNCPLSSKEICKGSCHVSVENYCISLDTEDRGEALKYAKELVAIMEAALK